MSVLEELHKSISEMTDEELEETFRQVRLSRRTFKPKKKTKTKAKAKAKSKTITLPSAKAISADDAAALLKTLGI